MLVIKRVVVWIMEMTCFVGFMSLVVHFLWGNFSSGPDQSIVGQLQFGVVAISFVLFGSGFFLTTAIFGAFWRSNRLWVYPSIAAALFVVHLQFAASGWTQREKAPIQLFGAAIIFLCTLVGGRLLRKWQGDSSRPLKTTRDR
jgi:hypothetical protein